MLHCFPFFGKGLQTLIRATTVPVPFARRICFGSSEIQRCLVLLERVAWPGIARPGTIISIQSSKPSSRLFRLCVRRSRSGLTHKQCHSSLLFCNQVFRLLFQSSYFRDTTARLNLLFCKQLGRILQLVVCFSELRSCLNISACWSLGMNKTTNSTQWDCCSLAQ